PGTGKRKHSIKATIGRKRAGRQIKERTFKKKVCLGEKKEIVNTYVFQGMKRDTALAIAGISKHQYYYVPRSGKKGKPTSETTLKRKGNEVEQVPNQVVIEQIKETHLDPDTIYGYHKMTYVLLILGFIIN